MKVIARVRVSFETEVLFDSDPSVTFRDLMQTARDIASANLVPDLRGSKFEVLHLGSEGEA